MMKKVIGSYVVMLSGTPVPYSVVATEGEGTERMLTLRNSIFPDLPNEHRKARDVKSVTFEEAKAIYLELFPLDKPNPIGTEIEARARETLRLLRQVR